MHLSAGVLPIHTAAAFRPLYTSERLTEYRWSCDPAFEACRRIVLLANKHSVLSSSKRFVMSASKVYVSIVFARMWNFVKSSSPQS